MHIPRRETSISERQVLCQVLSPLRQELSFLFLWSFPPTQQAAENQPTETVPV